MGKNLFTLRGSIYIKGYSNFTEAFIKIPTDYTVIGNKLVRGRQPMNPIIGKKLRGKFLKMINRPKKRGSESDESGRIVP